MPRKGILERDAFQGPRAHDFPYLEDAASRLRINSSLTEQCQLQLHLSLLHRSPNDSPFYEFPSILWEENNIQESKFRDLISIIEDGAQKCYWMRQWEQIQAEKNKACSGCLLRGSRGLGQTVPLVVKKKAASVTGDNSPASPNTTTWVLPWMLKR